MIQETSMLDLIGNKNNDVSSVRVHPGCTLKLFNEHNNVGLLDSLTANVTFTKAYNDQVSSLSCTCQGMIFRTLKTDSKKVTLNRHCFFLRVWPIRVCHLGRGHTYLSLKQNEFNGRCSVNSVGPKAEVLRP